MANSRTTGRLPALRRRGVIVVEPETGHLASGLSGLGRLAAPETIFDAIRATLGTVAGDLSGVRVLVTAGVLVVAKDDLTHRHLARQFAARTVEKEYLAIVLGVPARRQGSIIATIGSLQEHVEGRS